MSAVSATPPSLPESVQQWHCEMSETFGGLCPESSVDAAPVGTVSGVSLGDVGAFDISGSPQILRRSARAAKRHGSDLLKICTVRTGSAILRQSDRELTAPPGAMILYDVEHSYALRFDGHWSCTVMTLPRSAVSLTERELNCALERTPRRSAWVRCIAGKFHLGRCCIPGRRQRSRASRRCWSQSRFGSSDARICARDTRTFDARGDLAICASESRLTRPLGRVDRRCVAPVAANRSASLR